MPLEAARGRPGPKPNPDRGTPSGYRVNDRTRFELGMAASFLGTASMQDTIDLAVRELLDRMHAEPGFVEAIEAAEDHRRRRAGVQRLNSDDRNPPRF